MADTNQIFHQLLALVGQDIELGLRSNGERISGRVTYVMFDSFLLASNGKKRVVPFSDILFLDPIELQSNSGSRN